MEQHRITTPDGREWRAWGDGVLEVKRPHEGQGSTWDYPYREEAIDLAVWLINQNAAREAS